MRPDMLDAVRDAAESNGQTIGEFIRLAAYERAMQGRGTSPYKEVILLPRTDCTVDQAMEWLLSRSPSIGDLCTSEGFVHPRIRIELKRALSPAQYRRIMFRLKGHTFKAIGYLDGGISKQGIQQCIERAVSALSSDVEFLQALTEFLGGDIDASVVLRAIKSMEA